MAKHNTTNSQAATLARIKRTEAYAEKVRLLFAQTVNDILAINKTMPKLDSGVMFSFDGESLKKQKEVEALLRRLHSAVTMAIQQGVHLEWAQANAEADKLITSVFGQKVLSNPDFTAWTQRNTAARDAFLERSEKGLNLSDRVWKSVNQLRDEMEVAITVSIGEGKSASAMSREVRQYLNDPDLMFKRFRYKKGEDKDGNPVYGRKWKKRIKDEATGKYKWIDYDRDSYKTGAGVYKSSAKNAMRLTRTETNIAYRRADHERWKQMDFVLGQRVQLSRSHPEKDICDKLQGDYPKEFVFDGWHPQCFCFVTPILVDEEEMAKMNEAFLKGEKYTPKGKKITDYPANFKEWVREHEADIASARERGTEPYFIRNNATVINEILNPQPKELTAKEKAALRHAARTPEQEDAIKKAWAERKHEREVTKKKADNVLKIAQDWQEVDYSDLQSAINSGNYAKMKAASKAVAQRIVDMRNQEKALASLIPDVHTWHKSVTIAELQSVFTAVEAKLASWSGLTLEQQAKKLQFEAINFLGGNIKDVQSKFPKTWKISQAAYLKKLDEVNYKISINDIQGKLQVIKGWMVKHPKSLKVAGYVADTELAIANGEDIAAITKKLNLADKEYKSRLAEEARRNKKRLASMPNLNIPLDKSAYFELADDFVNLVEKQVNAGVGKYSNPSVKQYKQWLQHTKDAIQNKDITVLRKQLADYGIDLDDAYSDVRKDLAVWAQDTKEADSKLRGICGNIWQKASDEQKDAIFGYTGSYSNINEPLRGLTYIGPPKKVQEGLDRIPLITEIIDESSYDFDIWLQRGDGMVALKKFGLSNYATATDSEIYGLVGACGDEGAFWSAGVAKGKGFRGSVIFNIYAPRGTKMMYCEPFSEFGCGDGRDWDGIDAQSTFGYESEILLQRGTKFKITKVEKSGYTWYIDVEVISQHYLPFPYVGGYPYK